MALAELEALLAHELIHVKRWDNLTGYVQLLLCGVFWFHPLLWWLDRRLLAEREAACDEAVVRLAGRPDEYAATLLKVCRHALESSLAGVSRITESNLESRMERIMSISQEPTRAIWRRCLAAATLAAAVIFSIAAGVMGNRPLRAQQPVPPDQWLETAVSYVITDAERAAFERLTTQAEREHFIGQFWKVRDPTPATPQNEFKTEFDRRVQHSDRWSSDKALGWKTDRGRVYIVYGPPDEIESHPAKSMERWLYHSGVMQNVVLEFSEAGLNAHRQTQRKAVVVDEIEAHPHKLPPVLKKWSDL